MVLSDLSRGWYVTTRGISFLRFAVTSSFDIGKLKFIHFSKNEPFWIFSLQKPQFHSSFTFYKVFLIRAQRSNTQSLTEHYRSFSVVWMSRQVMEILMTISTFYKSVIILLFLTLTLRSRNTILSLLDSYLNSMSVWKSLGLRQKVGILCSRNVQIKKYRQYI